MQGVKGEVSGNFQLRVTNYELGVGVGSEDGAGVGRTGLGGEVLRGKQSHWKMQAPARFSPLP